MIKVFSFILLLINGVLSIANADNKIIDRLPENYGELAYKEVGSAKFSVLFWDIYNSTLYTKSGRYLHEQSPESLLFKIEYFKDITADELIERTVQQWQHLGIPKSQYANYIPKLKVIWPDISKGDSLTILVSEKKSTFYFNDKQVGDIEEKNFSRIFLDIWLSPNTSQAQLRAKLIEGNK